MTRAASACVILGLVFSSTIAVAGLALVDPGGHKRGDAEVVSKTKEAKEKAEAAEAEKAEKAAKAKEEKKAKTKAAKERAKAAKAEKAEKTEAAKAEKTTKAIEERTSRGGHQGGGADLGF